MEIDIVQVELSKKGSIDLNSVNGYAYGVETAQAIFVQQIGKSNVEMVALICLDHINKIINYSNIAIGTMKIAKVSLAQIFKVALLSNADKIIIAHNHPSGVLSITQADIDITKNIANIAKLFEIELLDSVIVNSNGEVLSIRENIKELENK